MPQSPFSHAIQGLQSVGSANRPLELYGLLNQRRDEVRGKLEKGAAYNPDELMGLRTALENRDADIEATGIPQQGRELDAYREQFNTALGEGFDPVNPIRAKAQYGRNLEQRRMDAPVRAAEAAAKGHLDVANAQAAMQERQFNQYRDLANQLMSSDAGAGGVKSMSVPGVGSVTMQTPPRDVNPNASGLSNVIRMRNEYEKAKAGAWSQDSSSVRMAKSNLDQAINNAIASWPVPPDVDPGITGLAASIANNPQFAEMDLQSALQALGEDQLTPRELATLNDILLVARGR